jgi:hypothetical protein
MAKKMVAVGTLNVLFMMLAKGDLTALHSHHDDDRWDGGAAPEVVSEEGAVVIKLEYHGQTMQHARLQPKPAENGKKTMRKNSGEITRIKRNKQKMKRTREIINKAI